MTAFHTENLSLLASAPNGIRRLRELILELAVAGRLVAQDMNVESGRDLLVRIGKLHVSLKKDKQTKPSSFERNELPDQLPTGWAAAQLGDVVEIVRGITFPASEKTKAPAPGRIACLRTANVQDQVEWDDLLYVGEEFVAREDQVLQVSDIVMSMANSRELVGKVALVTDIPVERASFGGFLGVIRPILMEPRFVMALLRTPAARRELIDGASQTTNIANISLAKLRPLPVAVPPLAEQRRIVAKVDELMALCDRLEARQQDAEAAHARLVQALLDSLTQARDVEEFQACWQRLEGLFGCIFTTAESIDALKRSVLLLGVTGRLVSHYGQAEIDGGRPEINPFTPPVGWVWRRFGDTWDSSFYGPRFGKETYVQDGGVPTIRTTDMTPDGRIDLKSPPQVALSPSQLQTYGLRSGDLLVTRSGSIGTMALFRLDLDAIPSAYLIRIRFLESLVPEFGHIYLRSPIGQALLGLNTTSVGVPNVNASKMAEFPIAIPSVEEQHRIVAKVTELLALCDQLKASIAAARAKHSQLAEALVAQAVAA